MPDESRPTPTESWTIYVCECGLISEGKDTHYRIEHAERVIQVIPRAPAEQRIEELTKAAEAFMDESHPPENEPVGARSRHWKARKRLRAALGSTEEQEAEGG